MSLWAKIRFAIDESLVYKTVKVKEHPFPPPLLARCLDGESFMFISPSTVTLEGVLSY